MRVTLLSSVKYDNHTINYGDCILIDTDSELIVYDCGHEEHAKRVEQYMAEHGYKRTKIVLSHNDSDHFNGIPYLVNKGLVSEVYTHLLFKYKDIILSLIDDRRRNRSSIAEIIKKNYDNIYSLSQKVTLKDIFEDTHVANNVTIIGPDKQYSLNAVAKLIDSRDSDHINQETIINAISTQLSISFGPNRNLLLTGDSNFETIRENITNHSAIQLPHHGKKEQADSIFEYKDNYTIFYVSDNTGDSNGGSSKLPKRGHVIYNTLDGDMVCDIKSFSATVPINSYYQRY